MYMVVTDLAFVTLVDANDIHRWMLYYVFNWRDGLYSSALPAFDKNSVTIMSWDR
jgi:hypothetical protein